MRENFKLRKMKVGLVSVAITMFVYNDKRTSRSI
ncbi:gram-positive signal peptide%2C ysirk family protein [Staphylococcus aureus]|nr:gram-positive signal peptide%2C ysirk family protein [Staphylococcus aureus]